MNTCNIGMMAWKALNDHVNGIDTSNTEWRIIDQVKKRIRVSIDPGDGSNKYSYQEPAVEQMFKDLERYKFSYLADKPGLGKTVQALKTVNKWLPKKLLIICPANARPVWRTHLKQWCPNRKVLSVVKFSDIDEMLFEEYDTVIVSYSMAAAVMRVLRTQFSDWIEEMKWGGLFTILDEAHYLKNPESKRTRDILALTDIVSKCYVLALSGTPATKSALDLWPLLYYCCPEVIDFMFADEFIERYCNVRRVKQQTRWGEKWVQDIYGARNQGELALRLLSTVMIRRDKTNRTPGKYYHYLYQNAENLRSIERDIRDTKDDPNIARKEKDKHIATLRKEMAISKVDAVHDIIIDILKNKPNIVVFCLHTELITRLKKLLAGYGVSVIQGSTTDNARIKAVEDFQNGKNKIFLGQIKAAGEAITLDQCNTVLFAETSWTQSDNEQCEDRCDRGRQKNIVNVYYAIVPGSVDERVINTANKKAEQLKSCIDLDNWLDPSKIL